MAHLNLNDLVLAFRGFVVVFSIGLLTFLAGVTHERRRIACYSQPEDEEISVARRPLTDEQIKECFDANGQVCPRCGDTEELNPGDLTQDDDAISHIDMDCDGCGEKWRIVYRISYVEPRND